MNYYCFIEWKGLGQVQNTWDTMTNSGKWGRLPIVMTCLFIYQINCQVLSVWVLFPVYFIVVHVFAQCHQFYFFPSLCSFRLWDYLSLSWCFHLGLIVLCVYAPLSLLRAFHTRLLLFFSQSFKPSCFVCLAIIFSCRFCTFAWASSAFLCTNPHLLINQPWFLETPWSRVVHLSPTKMMWFHLYHQHVQDSAI